MRKKYTAWSWIIVVVTVASVSFAVYSNCRRTIPSNFRSALAIVTDESPSSCVLNNNSYFAFKKLESITTHYSIVGYRITGNHATMTSVPDTTENWVLTEAVGGKSKKFSEEHDPGDSVTIWTHDEYRLPLRHGMHTLNQEVVRDGYAAMWFTDPPKTIKRFVGTVIDSITPGWSDSLRKEYYK